jgi:hypothetical protein
MESAEELLLGSISIANKSTIMDLLIIALNFYLSEGYKEEAKSLLEKFNKIKISTKDLLKNVTIENAEIVGSVLKNQFNIVLSEAAFFINNQDIINAKESIRKIKSNFGLISTYRMIYSNKIVLSLWSLKDKYLNTIMKLLDKDYKPVSFYVIFKALYYLNKEWSNVALLSMMNKQCYLYVLNDEYKKLERVNKRILHLREKEDEFFNGVFKDELLNKYINERIHFEDDGEDIKISNVVLSVTERIKEYHIMIQGDAGIIEEQILSINYKDNPSNALEQLIKLCKLSEELYKKHGGVLYARNYAHRLDKVAEIYSDIGNIEEALDWHMKSFKIKEILLNLGSYKEYAAYANCGESIGITALSLEDEKYYEISEIVFESVLQTRKLMMEKFPNEFIKSDLAVAYYNLALSQYKLEKFNMSFENFSISSDMEDSSAANYLGIAYEFGQGVKVDINQAKKYYKKAYEMGDDNGRVNLDRLEDTK